MKKVLFALPGVAAMSAFANTEPAASSVQNYNPTINGSDISFNLGTAAGIAIGLVAAVAGIRVFIKLINRGAGK